MNHLFVRQIGLLLLLVGTMTTGGCFWGGNLGVQQQVTNPGTAQDQQIRAKRFDPYLHDDNNSPVLSDMRPRDYDRPYTDTEIARARSLGSKVSMDNRE